MSSLVFPLVPWLLQEAFIAYFVAVAVYLASAGKSTFRAVGLDNRTDCNCPLIKVIAVSSNFYELQPDFSIRLDFNRFLLVVTAFSDIERPYYKVGLVESSSNTCSHFQSKTNYCVLHGCNI